jgi:inositol oxygenase
MKLDLARLAEEAFAEAGLRRYDPLAEDKIQNRVRKHYRDQHRFQTVDFVHSMHKKWLKFDHATLTVIDCLELLSQFLDESDPDVDVCNIVHAYQTAERLRAIHPDKPWLHLAGLIHDLGKVMGVWGEEQWAITGDTYPVGCSPAPSIVYGVESFEGNLDLKNPKYNTKLGIYKEHCGIENLLMTWTHDEYLYQVLKNHPQCTLPEEGLYAIRFHSFYPYHSSRDYTYFETEHDKQRLPLILQLNDCDLYSKTDTLPDIQKLRPYYEELINKYIPGEVRW